MTLQKIHAFLEVYKVEIGPELISTVTYAVMIAAGQARPLEPTYPVVFFDTLRISIREDAVVRNKTKYLTLL